MKPKMQPANPTRHDDDAETAAMRNRLQHLQSELDRLKSAIDEHFARLNAESAAKDSTKH